MILVLKGYHVILNIGKK